MSPDESFITEADRPNPNSDYKSEQSLSHYTVGEIASLFENITFWVAKWEDGKFSGPFHIAVTVNSSSAGATPGKRYSDVTLPELVRLLQHCEFRVYQGLQTSPVGGTIYWITGHGDSGGGGAGDGLEKIGALLPQFAFDVKGDGIDIRALHLKGGPVDEYEGDSTLVSEHGKFKIRQLLDALHHVKWSINPNFTLVAKKIHIE